jgi:hypothetical protein
VIPFVLFVVKKITTRDTKSALRAQRKTLIILSYRIQKYKTKLKELNLPQYSFRITGDEDREMILDPIRKKFVRLTPEEWVRQNFVRRNVLIYWFMTGQASP